MIEKEKEISDIGVEVVLVAYDERSLLDAKILDGISVPYKLLIDQERKTYRAWGLGRTGLTGAMLSPELNWRYLKLLLKGERFLGFAPDMFQLGGDFAIDKEGKIVFAHRMKNNGDRPDVREMLKAIEDSM